MISPLAYVDSAAKIGKNVTIQPFAFIEGNVEIGDDCIIMSGAKILQCDFATLEKGFAVVQWNFADSAKPEPSLFD